MYPMKNGKTSKLKQTVTVASAAARLLAKAPASHQAQISIPAKADTESDYDNSEAYQWSGFHLPIVTEKGEDKGIIRLGEFHPMFDSGVHFVMVDGDDGHVVYDSKTDGEKCFPAYKITGGLEEHDAYFANETDRTYYTEPGHTKLAEPWNPRPWGPDHVRRGVPGSPTHTYYSMVFHWKHKQHHTFELVDCSFIQKGGMFDMTKIPRVYEQLSPAMRELVEER